MSKVYAYRCLDCGTVSGPLGLLICECGGLSVRFELDETEIAYEEAHKDV